MTRRGPLLAAVLVTCAVGLSGCGAGRSVVSAPGSRATSGGSVPAASEVSPLPTASASPAGFSSPYLDAFERFWVAYAQADAAGDVSSAALARYASGAALAQIQGYVRADAARGVAHQGSWHFRSLMASNKTATSVAVSQCMDFSKWPVVASSGGGIMESYPAWSDLARARLQVVGGLWKVTELDLGREPC